MARQVAAGDQGVKIMTDEYVIETNEITKTYQMGEIEVQALCGVSIKIKKGEILSIMLIPPSEVKAITAQIQVIKKQAVPMNQKGAPPVPPNF